MKTIAALVALFIFTPTIVPASTVSSPPLIRVTPPAPRFTDAERQAELARRRPLLRPKWPIRAPLCCFSGEPKLYTNDVDYVFRQENNLFYLTNLAAGRCNARYHERWLYRQ